MHRRMKGIVSLVASLAVFAVIIGASSCSDEKSAAGTNSHRTVRPLVASYPSAATAKPRWSVGRTAVASARGGSQTTARAKSSVTLSLRRTSQTSRSRPSEAASSCSRTPCTAPGCAIPESSAQPSFPSSRSRPRPSRRARVTSRAARFTRVEVRWCVTLTQKAIPGSGNGPNPM